MFLGDFAMFPHSMVTTIVSPIARISDSITPAKIVLLMEGRITFRIQEIFDMPRLSDDERSLGSAVLIAAMVVNTRVGRTIIDNTIAPVKRDGPAPSIFAIIGEIDTSPQKPSTTEGMPANTANACSKSLDVLSDV